MILTVFYVECHMQGLCAECHIQLYKPYVLSVIMLKVVVLTVVALFLFDTAEFDGLAHFLIVMDFIGCD